MISPELAERLAREIAEAYAEAELRILAAVVRELSRGMDLPAWQETKLANLQGLRQAVIRELSKVNFEQALAIQRKISEAYSLGAASAVADLAASRVSTAALNSSARKAAVRAISEAVVGTIQSAVPSILRSVDDVYRQVVGRAGQQTLLSAIPRKQAAQAALDQLLKRGITVAPSRSDGRRMQLADYVGMAVRTGTAKAAIEGQIQTMAEENLDFVMIQAGPRHCDICDKWAGKVLWRGEGTPGRVEVLNVRTGRTMFVNVEGSLADARRAGWGHPNCRCSVGAYLPGLTKVPPRTPWDADGYAAQQRQRELEKRIRDAKREQAIAVTPEGQAAGGRKVADAQKALRDHLAANDELKRQRDREQVK